MHFYMNDAICSASAQNSSITHFTDGHTTKLSSDCEPSADKDSDSNDGDSVVADNCCEGKHVSHLNNKVQLIYSLTNKGYTGNEQPPSILNNRQNQSDSEFSNGDNDLSADEDYTKGMNISYERIPNNRLTSFHEVKDNQEQFNTQ